MRNGMRAIHQGGSYARSLQKPLGLSANALGRELHVPANRVTAILNEERAITADTAMRLVAYLGTSEEFWMNLQSTYELSVARATLARKIAGEVVPRVRKLA